MNQADTSVSRGRYLNDIMVWLHLVSLAMDLSVHSVVRFSWVHTADI